MDLGIAGRTALVCASSRGLGYACASALAGEGVDVIINGRDPGRLTGAAESLRDRFPEVTVQPVAADVTSPSGREALLAACPEPDILINNNGGPAPGPFLSKSHEAWLEAVNANMLAAVMLIRAVLPSMQAQKFGRIVNVTSAMVTAPRAGLEISSGPRAGLTAVCKALSREVAVDNVTINNLLPERFETDRLDYMAQRDADEHGISVDEARAAIARTIAAQRLGRPEEFGATCAFVCSVHAGYMTGANLHLDGGTYPGLV
jgi:3-oxoacyl-[acyl-carrier protein] reductase